MSRLQPVQMQLLGDPVASRWDWVGLGNHSTTVTTTVTA